MRTRSGPPGYPRSQNSHQIENPREGVGVGEGNGKPEKTDLDPLVRSIPDHALTAHFHGSWSRESELPCLGSDVALKYRVEIYVHDLFSLYLAPWRCYTEGDLREGGLLSQSVRRYQG